MTAYTDFHYSPTGSGVISGAQVLEQTEQGINGLGQYVQDNVSGAIDTANQALTIAQTADSNATLALNTANSFASAISAANNTANNALTTAQSAQSTANNASSLATTANNNANTALNAANTATANVGTLTNSVNALGNRMTTAENAISTNAGNITTLQTNLQTTNNNVTTAMNNASTAVATAQSAQQTATAAKNAAYVVRYTGTTITDGGTIAYTDIDNTDNIKAGDKIIDVTGNIYRIASVDLVNETVTVDASDIIHLAANSDVVHKTGNETIGGNKTFTGSNKVYELLPSQNGGNLGNASLLHFNGFFEGVYVYDHIKVNGDRGAWIVPVWAGATSGIQILTADGIKPVQIGVATTDANNRTVLDSSQGYINIYTGTDGTNNKIDILPMNSSNSNLGSSTYKWKTLNGINPGALSLPNSSQMDTVTIPSSWVWDGTTENIYTAPITGWIGIGSAIATCVRLFNNNSKIGMTQSSATGTDMRAYIPMVAGDEIKISGDTSSSFVLRIYPCLGNV